MFNLGITALISYQRALGVTSNNIANVNNEGYNRQTVEFTSRTPQFTGIGFLGNGVGINNIERVYSDVLTEELRNATSLVGESNVFYKFASEINDLAANPDAGIGPALQDFFNAVNDVSNDPASIPARQVMITQGNELSDRFNRFTTRFAQINRSLNEELGSSVSEINSITNSIARLNENIVVATGSGNGNIPNDLLDQRDQLFSQLSEHISITVVDEQDGSANVFMGKGQLLVNRFQSQDIQLTRNEFDPSVQDLAYELNGQTINITNQISGGTLGGVLSFRDQVLDPAKNSLGQLALTFAREFNTQHRHGLDLTGQVGANFFSESQVTVLTSINNTGVGDMTVEITDLSALTTSDYQLTYSGGDQYRLVRMSDGTRTNIDATSGYPSVTTIDGITLTINGAPAVNDVFEIQPTKDGASTFSMLVQDANAIAAASPVRADTSLANTGTLVMNNVELIDETIYVPDNYQMFFGIDSGAGVGGPQGTPVDADADVGDVLEYQLLINNVQIHAQGEAAAPFATLDDLATAINAQQSATGVRAYVDNGSGQLYLTNSPASSQPINVTENLAATSGAIEPGDSVTGYFGSTLDDTTVSNTITFNSSADSYIVLDSSNATVTSGAYTAGANVDFNGLRIQASGAPNAGDVISIDQNFAGAGDNRNALALANLRFQTTIANNTTTYQESYGQLVASVGTNTHQAELSSKAQTALLHSTQEERDSLSAVNLDEEAANMMSYQQAYQAAAQVIATADELFQQLLGMIGR